MKNDSGYGSLLANTRFEAFLWTQFLGAFNDNVYKMIVSIMAVRVAVGGDHGGRYLAVAGAVFVIPFLLFAGYAGQIADRCSKTRVLQVTKFFEIAVMLTGVGALLSGRMEALLVVLFLLAVQANFFSPAKYGILPELMGESRLSRANGLLELSTFIAIVVGTSFGTFLFERWHADPLRMGVTLLALAVVGSLLSLHIEKASAAGSSEPFHLNPFHEVIAGTRSLWREKPLLNSVLGISWFWFVGAIFQMALILAGKEVLHVSETQVGLLVTALAAGIGLGSILAGSLSGDHIELGLVPLGAALMGVSSMALGWTSDYHWALVWLAGVGFAGGLFAVPLNAFLQERADPAEKGRILATNNFINMFGVIFASGVLWTLHDAMGWSPSAIFLALGAAMLGGSVYVAVLMPDRTARFLLRCLANVMFRIRVEGGDRIPLHGGALLVSNHVSFADALLIGCVTPRFVHFLMWQKIFDAPGLTPLFRTLHAIPIRLEKGGAATSALEAARAALASGRLVGIFPEGSITRTGNVERFARGYSHITDGTGAPIIPIHISGLFGHPLSYKGGGPFRSIDRLWRPRVTVQIGDAVCGSIAPAELRQIVLDLASPERAA